MRIGFQIHQQTILKWRLFNSPSGSRAVGIDRRVSSIRTRYRSGEEFYNKTFANGKSFKDCFGEDGAVRGQYPYWDKERGMVVTMELAINECLEANGEKPLKYKKGKIADVTAYMSYNSRGQMVQVDIPSDDPRALAAYEDGKQHFYTKRGQLELRVCGLSSC